MSGEGTVCHYYVVIRPLEQLEQLEHGLITLVQLITLYPPPDPGTADTRLGAGLQRSNVLFVPKLNIITVFGM